MKPAPSHSLTRRHLVVGAALALPASAMAQTAGKPSLVGPLAPNPVEFKKTMEQFIGSATPQSEGLQLDVPVLADNPGPYRSRPGSRYPSRSRTGARK